MRGTAPFGGAQPRKEGEKHPRNARGRVPNSPGTELPRRAEVVPMVMILCSYWPRTGRECALLGAAGIPILAQILKGKLSP